MDGAVRLAYVLTGDMSLAEDLAQEAFVRVARRLGHLRSPESFPSYLRRSVVNLVRSHHRRKRLERAFLAREGRDRATCASQPDVAISLQVRSALDRLPVRQRAAVVLRFCEDLPEREIADALGCSLAATKSLVFRGVETLRALLGDEG